MGKTEKGAIWLNEELFSPYDYWQFWRNTDDETSKDFYFFTEIDIKEIDDLFKNEKNINNIKILLANEATKILHGAEASKNQSKQQKQFLFPFSGSELPEIKIKKGKF